MTWLPGCLLVTDFFLMEYQQIYFKSRIDGSFKRALSVSLVLSEEILVNTIWCSITVLKLLGLRTPLPS